jgi:hypothetical protein
MEVDATFIVQIGHFIIAYHMLKWFLFKPLVEKIHAEDGMMRGLQQEVDVRKMLIKQQEQHVYDQWIAYQQKFADAIPAVCALSVMVPPKIVSTPPSSVVNKQKKDMIVDALTQEIVARVGRVD